MIVSQDKPFILNFAIDRVSSKKPSIGGRYCIEKDMWVDDNGFPVIDVVGQISPELMTKTDVQLESDDQNFCYDILTKTKVQEESDDNGYSLDCMRELSTKTEVMQESDDNCYSFGVL